jgi:carbamoyltransferase
MNRRFKNIQFLYKKILGREPDEIGINHYYHSDMSLVQIQNILLSSEEYKNNNRVIVSASRGHNAAMTVLKNGEVTLHLEEERVSRFKHDAIPLTLLSEIHNYTDKINDLILCGFTPQNNPEWWRSNSYDELVKKIMSKNKNPTNYQLHDWIDNHHMCHAYHAFYNSGFEKALCVVVDGQGSFKDIKSSTNEIDSIFYVEYPDKIELLYNKTSPTDKWSVGMKYSSISREMGFGLLEGPGKIMGLSSYGKQNFSIPNMNDDSNYELRNSDKIVPFVKTEIMKNNRSFSENADYAYNLQKQTQEEVLNLLLKALTLKDCKNLCLSGGYGYNCVANYFYLDHLPEDVNFYVEPVSGDAGISMGATKKLWHKTTRDKTIRKQKTLYYGTIPKYDFDLNEGETCVDASDSDIIELIKNKNIVSLFQGRSECGPRALGNRSILFDPRVVNGKDIVNSIKRRENFRPFAASVLQEKAHEWFDMKRLKESPFMMYAVNVLSDKIHKIPAVTHVDNTCRVQTVSEDQNQNYYNLINEFYKQTGVPMLLNTSFNLAGEPLVETVLDALTTLRLSDIEYLYLPDIGKLITIKNTL